MSPSLRQRKPHQARHIAMSRLAPVLGLCLALAAAASADGKTSLKGKQHEQEQPALKSSSEAMAEQVNTADLFNQEEYVQIKPEEIGANEPNESALSLLEPPAASSAPGGPPVAPAPGQAEHKSADDELSAHLATDTISSLESIQSLHSAAPRARPPTGRPRPYHPPRPGPGRGASYPPPPLGYPPRSSRSHGPRTVLAPSYIALKGKLAGINSLVQQATSGAASYPPGPRPQHHEPPPHPAQHPQYQQQQQANGHRYLPKGAAAGYAAFRDFVRAQASRYKQVGAMGNLHEPVAYNAAPNHHGGRYLDSHPVPAPAKPYAAPNQPQAERQQPAVEPYGQPPRAQHPRAAQKTKVTVAQAYIPHLTPPAPGEAGSKGGPAAASYGPNPVLAKLYGGHAPQGVGRPEYNKDYGMVIHYPQATVYTEPMTVDQLHKLTGSGISQILEQLQYNLATGHRDESNTIRADNKHHIGNGVHIQAKEYYAPGKGGHYVPTTAAVISTSPVADNPEQPVGGSYARSPAGSAELPVATEYGLKPELGSGYERVKAAVASSTGQANYINNNNNGPAKAAADYGGPGKPAAEPAQAKGYAAGAGSGSGSGNGEPMSAITSLLGGELESLYRANAALTKQLEPEVHAQLEQYAKSAQAKGSLKYSELDSHQPLALGPLAQHPRHQQGPKYGPRPHQPQHHPRGRTMSRRPAYPSANRYQPRPQHHQARPYRGPGQAQPQRYNHWPQPHSQQQHHHQQNYNQQNQQQASYNAAEQAVHQQMMQLLHDFQVGDEQYNSKSIQTANQGYPNKVMQKHQQQQQQQAQGPAYGSEDGLEIPQGPNDQIGEISELIEALKGTLEAGRPEDYSASKQQQQPGKLEDVRYLASALGQIPSYAAQVPVHSGEAAVQKAAEKDHSQQPQVAPQTYQQQPVASYRPPVALSPYPIQEFGYQLQQQHQPPQEAYGQQQSYSQPAGQGQQPNEYQATQSDYQQQQQQPVQQQQSVQQQAAQAADYVQQVAQVATQAVGYQAPPTPQEPTSSYSNSEHSQVINHLVPAQAAEPQQQQSTSYEAAGSTGSTAPMAVLATPVAHPPSSQISVAAPTESQYQSAQALSSFVDSLPNDYQELLRQPAASLLDSAASGPDSIYSNATSAKKASAGAPSPADSEQGAHHQSTYQQVSPAKSSSALSSSSSSSSSSPSASSSSTSSLASTSSSSSSANSSPAASSSSSHGVAAKN